MPRFGILVVYVFDETLRPLFDIHLDHIRRHTSSEFKIYAAGHKLSVKEYDYVAGNPEISVFRPSVPREYGVRDEHSFCLRHLADQAFADGCEHVICMHLDSFPIVDDWEVDFLEPIEAGEADVVSIVPNGYSAGLCWGRKFDEEFAPGMLVSDDDRSGDAFLGFTTEFPDFDHVETGLGIIFAAYSRGLRWKRIGTDSARKIYGGILFHVVGATWRTWVDVAPIKKTFLARISWPVVRRLSRILPGNLRRNVRRLFIDYDKTSRDGSFNSKMAENLALIEDTDGYIAEQLRRYEASELAYR